MLESLNNILKWWNSRVRQASDLWNPSKT